MTRPDREGRALAMQYVRRYGRYKAALAQERAAILHGSPAPPDGQPRGGTPGDPTAQKVAALERLEGSHRARVVRVVEQARQNVGQDVFSDEERRALQRAVFRSCLRRSDNPYAEFAAGLNFSKSDFYRRRRRFLDEIAEGIEGDGGDE